MLRSTSAALFTLALAGHLNAQPESDPQPRPQRVVVQPQVGPPLVAAPLGFAVAPQATALPAGGGTVIIIIAPGQPAAAGGQAAPARDDSLREVLDLLRAMDARQRELEQRLRVLESVIPNPRPVVAPPPQLPK